MMNTRQLSYTFLYSLCIGTAAAKESVVLVTPLFMIVVAIANGVTLREFCFFDALALLTLLFFGVAPAQSLSSGYFIYSGTTYGIFYDANDIYTAMALVLLATCVSLLMFRFLGLRFELKDYNCYWGDMLPKENLLILAIISAVTYMFMAGGPSIVLSPRSQQDFAAANGSLIAPIFLATTTASVAYLVAERRYTVNGKSGSIYATLGVAVLMLCVNPFNSPRFFIMASWTPIVFAYLKGQISYRAAFSALVIGAFIVSPVLSNTTRSGTDALKEESFIPTAEQLRLKDADVFETLVHAIGYLRTRDYFLGENTISTILFAVPRSVWQGKPVVPGIQIGEELFRAGAAGTTNLSFTPIGDAYLDFGVLYVAIYIGAMAGISILLLRLSTRVDGANLVQAALIGSSPILLRGPLGAVIGYPLCILFMLLLLQSIHKDSSR